MKLISTVNVDDLSKCFVCIEAKYAKNPLSRLLVDKAALLELVYLDLTNFKNTANKGGKRYYVTFVGDCSRYTKVSLNPKMKSEKMSLKYKAKAENQLDENIKRLRPDRGGEYETNSLTTFCEKNGIIHDVIAPCTPQQNGIAKCKKELLKK